MTSGNTPRPRASALSRRGFLALAGIGASSVVLGGCGPTGLGGSSAPAGALRAAFGQPITDLDPYKANTAVDEATLIVKRLVFDTLVRREGAELAPGLALGWHQKDPNTWVFRLRPGVVFHDGTPLTARDIVACVGRTKAVASAQSPLWAPVKSVTADDDFTVTFVTDGPLGTLPINLTLLFIVPASLVAAPSQSRRPVGSGPFRVTDFTPSTNVELVRNDRYWGGPAELPAVSMPYIAETSSAITALRNNEIDLLWPVPPDQLAEVTGVRGLVVESVPSWTYFLNWFNCSRKPFDDPRVRRAMWQAVDVEGIVADLFGKGAEQMTAPIPGTVSGYAAQRPYTYDPDAAQRALRDAGWGDGFKTSMMWFDATGPLARELAQSMISAWHDIGIEVEPQSIEKAKWLQRLNSLDWDMNLQTNTVTTGDAAFTVGRLYTSKANRMGYKNPDLDRVLAEAGRSGEAGERARLYGSACKTIWDDAVGIFPATLVSSYGRDTGLVGFAPAANNQPDLTRVGRR